MLLLDAGDLFGAASETNSLEDRLRAEYLVRGMNLCGYDASGLGEADFRFGETFFALRQKEATFPFIAANVVRESDASPYLVGTLRKAIAGPDGGAAIDALIVGIVGDGHGDLLASATHADGEPLTLEPAQAAVRAALKKAGPAELRIVLAHMPVDAARTLTQALVDAQSDVDVVIVAHEPNEPLAAESIGRTVLVGTGHDGKWIGQLELEVAPGAGLLGVVAKSVVLDASHADDPAAASLYQDFLARLKTEIDELAKDIPQQEPAGGGYVGVEACRSCHPTQVTQWESTSHAHAWNTLVLKNHDYAPSCYGCHTTGFGFKSGFTLPTQTMPLANVQCEMCHGPAADHVAAPKAGWSADPKTKCAGCHEPHRSPNFDLGTYLPKITH